MKREPAAVVCGSRRSERRTEPLHRERPRSAPDDDMVAAVAHVIPATVWVIGVGCTVRVANQAALSLGDLVHSVAGGCGFVEDDSRGGQRWRP